MIQTINLHEFRKAFHDIRPTNFSHDALGILFEYLDEIDSEYELDVISICCDFTECSLDEFFKSYSVNVANDATDEQKREAIKNHIEYHGFWFGFVNDGQSIVYENF
jgi:hypothetical protein